MKVAIIGLGHMGMGMARNLVKAGHDVTAFDLSGQAMEPPRKRAWQRQHRDRKRWPTSKSSLPCSPLASMY